MSDSPVTIERMRELLKQNAPFVYQQVTLHKPLETEQIKIELKIPEKKKSSPEDEGAADFQKYLDDDWAKRNPPIENRAKTGL